MERVFVDTSAWYSYLNRAGGAHAALANLIEAREGRLVTSTWIFSETVTLCLGRRGHDVAVRVGAALRQDEMVTMVRVTADDEDAAWKLFQDRPDKEYSLTDCTSFVVMRRLRLRKVVTLDEDFRREGFETLS